MGFLVELVLVALFEVLGWYATRALETRAVAASLWLVLTATGFGGGVAWGAYTGSSDFVSIPLAPWIVLVVAIVAGVMAVRARPQTPGIGLDLHVARLALFAVFNVAIAAGIGVGYSAV
jgi:hypothetical protein